MPDPTPAEREALAKARQAEAAAQKAELELADMMSPDGVLARAAKNRQAAAAAQQAQISAMIPDLSKVKDSTLAVSGSGALGGSGLTFGCVDDAAASIAAKLNPAQGTQWRILVTSDADFASADTVRAEVASGLDMLTEAAEKLLTDTTAKGGEQQKPRGRSLLPSAPATAAGAAGLAAGPLVAAAAAAIPQILSVLSAERSLTMSSVTVSDLAASAAVAARLIAKKDDAVRVMHDDFRKVPTTGIHARLSALGKQRIELAGRKLELATRKSALEGEMKDGGTADQKSKLAMLVAASALVDSLLGAIDAFLVAIRTVPTGGRRTPLATAALYDAAHDTSKDKLTHVLLVKAQPSQSAMLTDDRPFMFPDKFSTLVEVSVTYMLLATDSPWLVQSGTVTAMTMAHGKMGERITLEDRVQVSEGNGQRNRGGQASSAVWSGVRMKVDRTTGDD